MIINLNRFHIEERIFEKNKDKKIRLLKGKTTILLIF